MVVLLPRAELSQVDLPSKTTVHNTNPFPTKPARADGPIRTYLKSETGSQDTACAASIFNYK